MTQKITFHCDNFGCSNELDIEFPNDYKYEFDDAKWQDDDTTMDTHYCPTCWEKMEHKDL